jgi:HK97 gp10 family phage protein
VKASFNLVGFEETRELLKRAPATVERRVLQKATNAGAREGAKAVRRNTPRHLDEQSPASKQYGPGFKNIRTRKLRRVPKGSKGTRIDTGNAFWLYFYELGTRYQPARPFFARTVRAVKDAIFNAMAKSMRENIPKEMERLARKTGAKGR